MNNHNTQLPSNPSTNFPTTKPTPTPYHLPSLPTSYLPMNNTQVFNPTYQPSSHSTQQPSNIVSLLIPSGSSGLPSSGHPSSSISSSFLNLSHPSSIQPNHLSIRPLPTSTPNPPHKFPNHQSLPQQQITSNFMPSNPPIRPLPMYGINPPTNQPSSLYTHSFSPPTSTAPPQLSTLNTTPTSQFPQFQPLKSSPFPISSPPPPPPPPPPQQQQQLLPSSSSLPLINSNQYHQQQFSNPNPISQYSAFHKPLQSIQPSFYQQSQPHLHHHHHQQHQHHYQHQQSQQLYQQPQQPQNPFDAFKPDTIAITPIPTNQPIPPIKSSPLPSQLESTPKSKPTTSTKKTKQPDKKRQNDLQPNLPTHHPLSSILLEDLSGDVLLSKLDSVQNIFQPPLTTPPSSITPSSTTITTSFDNRITLQPPTTKKTTTSTTTPTTPTPIIPTIPTIPLFLTDQLVQYDYATLLDRLFVIYTQLLFFHSLFPAPQSVTFSPITTIPSNIPYYDFFIAKPPLPNDPNQYPIIIPSIPLLDCCAPKPSPFCKEILISFPQLIHAITRPQSLLSDPQQTLNLFNQLPSTIKTSQSGDDDDKFLHPLVSPLEEGYFFSTHRESVRDIIRHLQIQFLHIYFAIIYAEQLSLHRYSPQQLFLFGRKSDPNRNTSEPKLCTDQHPIASSAEYTHLFAFTYVDPKGKLLDGITPLPKLASNNRIKLPSISHETLIKLNIDPGYFESVSPTTPFDSTVFERLSLPNNPFMNIPLGIDYNKTPGEYDVYSILTHICPEIAALEENHYQRFNFQPFSCGVVPLTPEEITARFDICPILILTQILERLTSIDKRSILAEQLYFLETSVLQSLFNGINVINGHVVDYTTMYPGINKVTAKSFTKFKQWMSVSYPIPLPTTIPTSTLPSSLSTSTNTATTSPTSTSPSTSTTNTPSSLSKTLPLQPTNQTTNDNSNNNNTNNDNGSNSSTDDLSKLTTSTTTPTSTPAPLEQRIEYPYIISSLIPKNDSPTTTTSTSTTSTTTPTSTSLTTISTTTSPSPSKSTTSPDIWSLLQLPYETISLPDFDSSDTFSFLLRVSLMNPHGFVRGQLSFATSLQPIALQRRLVGIFKKRLQTVDQCPQPLLMDWSDQRVEYCFPATYPVDRYEDQGSEITIHEEQLTSRRPTKQQEKDNFNQNKDNTTNNNNNNEQQTPLSQTYLIRHVGPLPIRKFVPELYFINHSSLICMTRNVRNAPNKHDRISRRIPLDEFRSKLESNFNLYTHPSSFHYFPGFSLIRYGLDYDGLYPETNEDFITPMNLNYYQTYQHSDIGRLIKYTPLSIPKYTNGYVLNGKYSANIQYLLQKHIQSFSPQQLSSSISNQIQFRFFNPQRYLPSYAPTYIPSVGLLQPNNLQRVPHGTPIVDTTDILTQIEEQQKQEKTRTRSDTQPAAVKYKKKR